MSNEIDGFYAAFMTGVDGEGFAFFVFQSGDVIGADPWGVRFDGDYELMGNGEVVGTITVTVPPGGTVIQGVTVGAEGLAYQVPMRIPANFAEVPYLNIDTPLGPVNVKLKRVRGLKKGES